MHFNETVAQELSLYAETQPQTLSSVLHFKSSICCSIVLPFANICIRLDLLPDEGDLVPVVDRLSALDGLLPQLFLLFQRHHYSIARALPLSKPAKRIRRDISSLSATHRSHEGTTSKSQPSEEINMEASECVKRL